MPRIVTQLRSFVIFPLKQQLPNLREDTGDVGRLKVLARHEYTFMTKGDLVRIGLAGKLDTHHPIARDEERITRRCDAAEPSTRDNVPPDSFGQGQGRDLDAGPFSRHRSGHFGEQLVFSRAAKIFGRTNFPGRARCLLRGCGRWSRSRLSGKNWRQQPGRACESGGQRTLGQEVSASHAASFRLCQRGFFSDSSGSRINRHRAAGGVHSVTTGVGENPFPTLPWRFPAALPRPERLPSGLGRPAAGGNRTLPSD